MNQNATNQISAKVVGVIFAAGLMSFCGVIVETAMNITFPTLMKEFNVTTGTVQWLTTGYLLVVSIMVPLSAALKRKFKMKVLFLTAITLFSIGIIMDAFAPVFAILFVGRIVQGIGTGIALPLMFNIILEQVPLSKIGMMMGVGTLITAIAPAIGPTFGGIVVATLGWRYIFAFLLPILLISLILGLTCIQQKSSVLPTKIDLGSLLTIMIMFIGLIVGFSNLSSYPIMSWQVMGAWVLGVIGLISLVIRSSRIATPIINLRVFRNGRFAGHIIGFFLFQLTALGLSFVIPNYIQLVNHSSSTIAGLIVLPGAALGACLAPVSGRILDRFGAKLPIIVGSLLATIAMIGFSLMSRSMNNGAIIVAYMLFMLGIGLSYGNIMTSGLKQLSAQQQADGNAIMNTLQQFAGAMGTSIVSAVIAASQGSLVGGRTVTTAIGSQHAYIIMLICLVIELVVISITLLKMTATRTNLN